VSAATFGQCWSSRARAIETGPLRVVSVIAKLLGLA
jgi:hypothetical protein